MKSAWNTKVIHGDQILILRKIRPFHIGDYLRFFILLFINLWYIVFLQWSKICMFHHGLTIREYNGVPCVFEALDKGYCNAGPWSDYLKDPTIKAFLIRRPNFIYSYDAVKDATYEMLGTPYDYWGTLFLQLINNLTFGYVWLGKRKNALNKLYCTEANGYCINKMSNGKYAQQWPQWSPMHVYSTEILDTILK